MSCCCRSLGCAVSNGCDISQRLLLTPLHCCRWGVWLTRHAASAPARTQWTLALHTVSNAQTYITRPLRSDASLRRAHPDFPYDHCWRTESGDGFVLSDHNMRPVPSRSSIGAESQNCRSQTKKKKKGLWWDTGVWSEMWLKRTVAMTQCSALVIKVKHLKLLHITKTHAPPAATSNCKHIL